MIYSWVFMKQLLRENAGGGGDCCFLFLTHSHDNSQVSDLVALASKLCSSSQGALAEKVFSSHV